MGEKIAEATDDRLLHDLSEQWGDHQVKQRMYIRADLLVRHHTYFVRKHMGERMEIGQLGGSMAGVTEPLTPLHKVVYFLCLRA